VIPGASSVTSALQISSIPINKYIFHGFLPKSKKNINDFINLLKRESLTSVFFVSRHKVLSFLELLVIELADKRIAVCKEITKLNEKVFVGFPEEVLKKFKQDSKNSLGEFVLVIEGVDNPKKQEIGLLPETKDIIKKLLKKFSLTDTVEIVHKIGNIGKKELYKNALDIQNKK
jgi:16S rRNA (cytidine1402-2'-O)-methyltransferase